MFKLAVEIAKNNFDKKTHYFGAIGERFDGTIVSSTNGSPRHYPVKEHHCEARLVRKLDVGSVVYLARVRYKGIWAMSKPCPFCENVLRARGVKRVYYTIDVNEYGVLIFR